MMKIVTTSTGFFKPGLKGHILAIHEREIYVGHMVKMVIPEFLIELNGDAQIQLCQYGRDFRMDDVACKADMEEEYKRQLKQRGLDI